MSRTKSAPGELSGSANDPWRLLLRAERQRLNLTQAALAGRAGVSAETLRKYENGDRTPGRATAIRVLGALQIPQTAVRSVLLELGFAAEDTLFPAETHPEYYFVPAELEAFVESVPWPVFVANNTIEIVAANFAAQRLWGVDLRAEIERRTRAQINFLAIAAERHFAARIANWPELVGVLVSVLKAVPQSRSLLDQPESLFAEVFATFAASDPSLIAPLFALWEATPARTAKVRWTYPVVWHEPGFDDIRFLGIVNPASEPDGLSFNDWLPADARSHAVLEAILSTRTGSPTDQSKHGTRPGD